MSGERLGWGFVLGYSGCGYFLFVFMLEPLAWRVYRWVGGFGVLFRWVVFGYSGGARHFLMVGGMLISFSRWSPFACCQWW